MGTGCSEKEMKYSKEQYLDMMDKFPIWGFPTEAEQCYSSKMVKTRALHPCAACQYCKAPESAKDQYLRFPRGTLMFKEVCISEGWKSSYTCTYCLDYWIDGILDHCGRI